MSLKSSIIALAGTIGRCQENSRSLKQALELGLTEMSKNVAYEEYGEDEVVVGTWIDGSTLYRKYVKVLASDLTSAETVINHGISNVARIVGVDGIVIKGSTGSTPLTTYHSNSAWACGIYNLGNTSFTFYAGSSLKSNIVQLDVFLTYVKATS